MTPTAKNILRNSINIFLVSTSEEKERYIQAVQKNLNNHKNAMECIGMGYCRYTAKAGEIFIRLFAQKS